TDRRRGGNRAGQYRYLRTGSDCGLRLCLYGRNRRCLLHERLSRTKNEKRARAVLGNAVFLLFFIAVAVTCLLLIVRKPLLYLLGCSDTLFPYAETYFTIYICGTLFALLGIGLNHFLLAQGFARQGMIAVAFGAIVNVVLDPILIFVLDMGIAGAATATVISQCCMAAFVIFRLCSKNMPIRFHFCRPEKFLCKRIVTVGSMSFLITILDNLIIIFLNVVLRRYGGSVYGDQLITCATVIQSFLTIVFCPAQGITSGCTNIFGYHYGAKHYRKTCQAFAGVFLLCGVYIGILQVAVQIRPQLFAGLFLQNTELMLLASASLRMYTLGLIGVAVQYALVDGLTAMGKVRYAFPLSIFRKLLYMACIFILPMVTDIRHVFYAGSISDIVGATFSAVVFFTAIIPRLRREMQCPIQ
ncbi:MAG: polysaccharide biosynthesis C-terminal domain-containing protein, partial [Clostridiales bacterium]|nr:polysaccharide biosynthesis C-terminal domain-containing protein [Clostridiales bacterium]